MSRPRRNIIRPVLAPQQTAAQANRKRQQIQAEVDKANATIERWWRRLSRAANVIDKSHKQIARLRRQLREMSADGA